MRCEHGCGQEKDDVMVLGDANLCVQCLTAGVQVAQRVRPDVPFVGMEWISDHQVKLSYGNEYLVINVRTDQCEGDSEKFFERR
ncbi:TPA: hypothetical protein DF272_04020 [Candidatus Falkowbacteria bacterium]|nr:hypothetical protein [Candidatus Falkowbacteria bacterium]